MVLMILLTLLDIAYGHKVPTDQLILWDTAKTKEVFLINISLCNILYVISLECFGWNLVGHSEVAN